MAENRSSSPVVASGSDSDDRSENAPMKREAELLQSCDDADKSKPEWRDTLLEQDNSAELSDKTNMIFANITTDGKDGLYFTVAPDVTFYALKKQITGLFLSLDHGMQFNVRCMDADGDIIPISTDEEVRTALNKLSANETWLLLAAPCDEPPDRSDLEKVIKDEVFPCITSISIQKHFRGTGFFQHVSWLVSNAHVLSSWDDVCGATMSNSQIESTTLSVKNQNAYFHPSEQSKSPDIVVLEITDACSLAFHKSLPTQFPENDRGKIIREGIYFYTYIDPWDEEYKIKYLLPHTMNGLPLLFRCEDNIDPMPGCSGAPIIQTQAVDAGLGKTIWQFKVIGIVYATCTYFLDTRLVCGVPLCFGLKQIQTILNEKKFQQMLSRISLTESEVEVAANCLGDKDKKAAYNEEANAAQLMAMFGFKKFEGKTIFNISVPNGFQTLAYPARIIELNESLLIPKNQKNHPLPIQVELDDLEKDYEESITSIEKADNIKLACGKLFQSKYFRIDVLGGSTTHWILQLQDNTRKGVKVGSKSASSVLAIVKVLKEQEAVSGEALAKALRNSQREKIAYEYTETGGQPQQKSEPQQKSGSHRKSRPKK